MLQLGLKEECFNELSVLIDICGTFQASSADCERGFSTMNAIKTNSRNRLEVDNLEKIMRIKLHLDSEKIVDLDKVYLHWKNIKARREKQK